MGRTSLAAWALVRSADLRAERGARADEVFSTYGNTPDLPTHELRFSTLSAPSSLLALVHTYGGTLPQNLSFVVEHIPNAGTPRDPRQVSVHHPTSSPEYSLWRYGGSKRQVPLPVPDIPDPYVQEQVGQLAALPFVRERWWAEAKALGADIGPDHVRDVLGCMVHPPEVPDDEPASPWVFRHQLAACMVLAHVDSGWRSSTRREVLCDLLFGVVDWACDAAALALTELALDEPVVSLDVRHWLELRLSDVADTPYVGLQRSLTECLLRFAGMGDAERSQLKQRVSSSGPTRGT